MAAIAVFLTYRSVLAISGDKANFFTTLDWNASGLEPKFGIAVLAFGTVVSSVVAMVIAVPVAVGIALFISHYAPRKLSSPLGYVIDLLAAVPSIIYGLWGALFLVPHLTGLYTWLDDYLGWTGIFSYGGGAARSLFTVGILLAIMILPIVTSVSREVFLQVPKMHEEAALALGATRWEVIRMSVLPFGRSGVISASMLGLGRALGETMAVATVLSPSFLINTSLLDPGGGTFAQNIASKFSEADRIRPGRPDRLRPRPLRDHAARQRRGPPDHRPPQGVLGSRRMSIGMSTTDRPAVSNGGSPLPVSLQQARLPRWTPPVLALVAAGAGCGIGLGAGLDSTVQWGLIAALLFVFGTFALAAVVEGARQAKDRLATSLVWIAFLIAVVPLASLLWETVAPRHQGPGRLLPVATRWAPPRTHCPAAASTTRSSAPWSRSAWPP